MFQDLHTFLQSIIQNKNSTPVAHSFVANLKLTNNKGAEILSFYREHCPELNDTLANATSLDATYEIIVHWSQNHHGDNLSPHVNASTRGMSMYRGRVPHKLSCCLIIILYLPISWQYF